MPSGVSGGWFARRGQSSRPLKNSGATEVAGIGPSEFLSGRLDQEGADGGRGLRVQGSAGNTDTRLNDDPGP